MLWFYLALSAVAAVGWIVSASAPTVREIGSADLIQAIKKGKAARSTLLR